MPLTSSVKKPAAKAPAPKKPVAKKAAPAKKSTAAARPAPLRFDAPSDFKPYFCEVRFKTGEDALISPVGFKASRVKGRWDNQEAPRFDLKEYDVPTLLGIMSRLSAVTFAPNVLRRLPANTSFLLILRVNRRSADNSLAIIMKAAAMSNSAGKLRWFKEKADPVYRRLRRSVRILPSAFVDTQLPPSRRRSKKDSDSDEE